jgi:dihydroflavonol-4-reductase
VIVNPGYMLGPWDWKPSSGEMLLEVARQYTPFAPRGGVAVCDVRDVAGGILAALEKGRSGERYILGGHNLTYLALWQIFADITKTSRPFFRMTRGMGWIGGAWGDAWTRITGKEGNVNSAATRMSGQLHFYSSAKAEEELGYTYGSVEQAVRDAWEWFQQHGYI